MYCKNCGSPIDEGDAFCGVCGHSIEDDSQETEVSLPAKKKNKIPLAVLIPVVFGVVVAAVIIFLVIPAMKQKSQKAVLQEQKEIEVGEAAQPNAPDQQIPAPETDDFPTEDDPIETVTIVTPYHRQRILIQKGSLTLEEWDEIEYQDIFSCDAKVSPNGVTTNKREGDKCTPGGTFNIMFCLGVSWPDTGLDFQPVNKNSVWVDDVNSYYYNTLQSSSDPYKDWNSAENMDFYFSSGKNNYGIFFDYNGDGISGNAVSGNGSAIFLMGRTDYNNESPENGDIYISAGDMSRLLELLDQDQNPQIVIQ